jgi:poly-beta-1,6-N-acetyl-D-glucosamine synthase
MYRNIAIMIPAHNEETVLRGTIDALFEAGANPADIYVVDDASKDKTSEIAHNCGVKLLTLTANCGKAVALRKLFHYYLLSDRYEFVILLDADTKVDNLFLQAFSISVDTHPDVALYVGQVVSAKGGFISAGRAVEYAIGQDLFKSGMSEHGLIFVAPGCASMYRSAILKQLKFEGDTLAEDMDLTMQVQRMREKIVYVPDAIVITQDPGSVKDYIKQVTRWFRGTWQVMLKHRVLSIGKKQKVDLTMIFLMLDALIFNRFIWVALAFWVFAFTWTAALAALAIDTTVAFLIAVYAAIKNRRMDVIYKFPMYFWMTGYLNPLLFLKTFFEIIVFKRVDYAWNKVVRY